MAVVVSAVLCPGRVVFGQGHHGGTAAPHEPKGQQHPKPGHAQAGPAQPGRPQPVQPPAGGAGPRPVEEFMRMSPADREKEIQKLPPARQEKVRQQLQRYDQLPPERKALLQRLWDLPPGRRQVVRQSMQDFQTQPPERKRAMWQQLQKVHEMEPGERDAYFDSPEFKGQYSKDEQEIMKNMSEILPK
jgi:Protein of unknown function (DUF3106)